MIRLRSWLRCVDATGSTNERASRRSENNTSVGMKCVDGLVGRRLRRGLLLWLRLVAFLRYPKGQIFELEGDLKGTGVPHPS